MHNFAWQVLVWGSFTALFVAGKVVNSSLNSLDINDVAVPRVERVIKQEDRTLQLPRIQVPRTPGFDLALNTCGIEPALNRLCYADLFGITLYA